MDGGTYSDTLGVRDDESFVVSDEKGIWPEGCVRSWVHVTLLDCLAVFVIFRILGHSQRQVTFAQPEFKVGTNIVKTWQPACTRCAAG